MDLNKAIITTKRILSKESPVLTVYHDLEDDWQFLDNQELFEEDAVVISFGQILELDETLKNILSLEEGYLATRKSLKDNNWIIQRDE